MKLDTIIALLRNLNSDSIDRVISELEVELRERSNDLLHGRINALEGIR